MSEISPAQRQFLLRKRRERILIALARILLMAGFLILWEAAARYGWIDSFIFSSPGLIWKTFVEMCMNQFLFSHIVITLKETLLSFFFVVILGIFCAVLLWASNSLSRILEPYLVALNSLPKSALAPLLIVWLGANERTIIVAGMSVAVFGSVINLYTGFQSVDPEKLKLIATLGGSRRDELTKIVLPSSVPLILSVMKVNIGLCLVGVIIGEFIGARKGLGYLIIYGSQTFRYARILIQSAIVRYPLSSIYTLYNETGKRLDSRFPEKYICSNCRNLLRSGSYFLYGKGSVHVLLSATALSAQLILKLCISKSA